MTRFHSYRWKGVLRLGSLYLSLLASFEVPKGSQIEPNSISRLSGEAMSRSRQRLPAHTSRFWFRLEVPMQLKSFKNHCLLLLGKRQ